MQTMGSLPGAKRCIHCFSTSPTLRCAWRGHGVRLAVSLKSFLALDRPLAPVCVSREAAGELRLWGEVVMQRAYWEMMLGGAYAARSLKWLLPITVSLMMGAAYGTRIARSVIPFSRI